jgi:hypothetical protein
LISRAGDRIHGRRSGSDPALFEIPEMRRIDALLIGVHRPGAKA